MFAPESLQSQCNAVLSCDVTAIPVTLNKLGMVHSAGNAISGMFTRANCEQHVFQETEVLNMCLDWIIFFFFLATFNYKSYDSVIS